VKEGQSLIDLSLKALSDRERANISGWLRDNQGVNLSSMKVDDLVAIRSPRYIERVDSLLYKIGKDSEYVGSEVRFNQDWISTAWCVDGNEVRSLLMFLKETDKILINLPLSHSESFVVRPKGWMRIDELERINSDSEQAFIAMWFNENMSEVYAEAIAKAIDDAGYRPLRVDKKEHSGKIDDEIVAEIRKSRFVVADFTGQRGGVYFEAGFAKGLGLEVFWTCRDDHFKELHFDIRQYNCIQWNINDLHGFRNQLHYRIESVLGRGPVKK